MTENFTISNSNLLNSIVLVTGAGRGAGRAIAQRFAAQKATLAINDINPDKALETVRSITEGGGRAREYLADVSKKISIQGMISQVEDDWGKIDILINNARVVPRRPMLDMDEWEWRRTLDVNLTGTFVMSQVVGRVMRAGGKGGLIINMVPHSHEEQHAAFRAAQAGILALTRAGAQELQPYAIRYLALVFQEDSTSYAELAEKTLSLCRPSDETERDPVVYLGGKPV